MQVEGQQAISVVLATGARVSNAFVTYPYLGDSPKKFGLISHKVQLWHHDCIKAPAVKDGHA